MPSTEDLTLSLVARGQRRLGADIAVLAAASGDKGPRLLGAPLDAARVKAIEASLAGLAFTGSADALLRVAGSDADPAPVLLIAGLGSVDDEPSAEQLRRGAGAAARSLAGVEKAVFLLPADDEESLAAVAEGASLGAYAFNAQKSQASEPKAALREAVIASDLKPARAAKAVLQRAAVVARRSKAARDLVNTPANVLFPSSFVDEVKASAKGVDVKVTVWDEKKLESEGFGGILGVGRGSVRPPRLVKVDYAPMRAKGHLAIVGKGITFDTGGISLKPAPSMEEMKSDMAGAAAALQAVLAAAELGLRTRVTAWLCLAENMPSGDATRPGDVLRMYNGKTVEVTNTDAEGRLVMGDGLSKASEDAPDLLLGIATLTGAQIVALGHRTAGLMGDDAAVDAVKAAADAVGEPFWPMPFPDDIRPDLDSDTADLRNSGNRDGGMLKAGVFLKEFVGADGKQPGAWGHLDIAGPSFNGSKPFGHTPKQGTGFGVRTLVRVAEDLAESE